MNMLARFVCMVSKDVDLTKNVFKRCHSCIALDLLTVLLDLICRFWLPLVWKLFFVSLMSRWLPLPPATNGHFRQLLLARGWKRLCCSALPVLYFRVSNNSEKLYLLLRSPSFQSSACLPSTRRLWRGNSAIRREKCAWCSAWLLLWFSLVVMASTLDNSASGGRSVGDAIWNRR